MTVVSDSHQGILGKKRSEGRGWGRWCLNSRLSFAGALVLFAASVLLFSERLTAQETPNYRIAPNDLLDFRVFQEPDLDGVVRIAGDGSAVFPLVGSVSLSGKTIGEAVEILKARYRDGYLVNPQISLTVREYATGKFTVLGQVKKPGAYSMTGNETVTLLQAIGLAGGYTRIADAGNITIKRNENGVERVVRLNAKKMAREESSAVFYVKPGDVITVGESLF